MGSAVARVVMTDGEPDSDVADVASVGLRMRLVVTPDVAAVLDAQSRMHGWLHNQLVSVTEEMRARIARSLEMGTGKDDEAVALLYSQYGLRNLLTALKLDHPFLRECWTYSLQCVAMRLTRTIKERRARQDPRASWPTYHRWSSRWASLEYHILTGGFALDGRALTLTFGKADGGTGPQQRVTVHLAQSLPRYARPATIHPGDKETTRTHPIRGLRIIREHGVYYVVWTVRRALISRKEGHRAQDRDRARVIALDPHHYSLAVGVDTEGRATRYPYPPGIRVIDRGIDRLKARRDQCQRHEHMSEGGTRYYTPSRRRAHFEALIQREQRRREGRITTYLYEIANSLCRDYDVIAIGNYAPSSLAGDASDVAALNRWTHAESLVGRLRQTVAWVARRSGRRCIILDEAGTTRTCHECGYVWLDGIPTKLRYWVCPGCGQRQARNINNARNLLRAAHEQLNNETNQLPRSGRLMVPVTIRRTWRSAGMAAG